MDDFNFEDDFEDSSEKKLNKGEAKKGGDKFSKAQKQLMDHDEEETKGYNMRMKGPGKQAKSKFEVFDVVEDDDIVEEIQSDHGDANNMTHKESESARGFGITVSQSLGIDKSVDSLAIDEYDHIEEID